MKTLKKFIFFIISFNLIFILILNSQYIYRFGMEKNFSTSFIYSSILPFVFSFIPFACFAFSLLISNKFFKRNLLLKSVLISLITVILSFVFMEIITYNHIFSLITVISTVLTLLLFFYRYRQNYCFLRNQ
jgi:hypothetical protein